MTEVSIALIKKDRRPTSEEIYSTLISVLKTEDQYSFWRDVSLSNSTIVGNPYIYSDKYKREIALLTAKKLEQHGCYKVETNDVAEIYGIYLEDISKTLENAYQKVFQRAQSIVEAERRRRHEALFDLKTIVQNLDFQLIKQKEKSTSTDAKLDWHGHRFNQLSPLYTLFANVVDHPEQCEDYGKLRKGRMKVESGWKSIPVLEVVAGEESILIPFLDQSAKQSIDQARQIESMILSFLEAVLDEPSYAAIEKNLPPVEGAYKCDYFKHRNHFDEDDIGEAALVGRSLSLLLKYPVELNFRGRLSIVNPEHTIAQMENRSIFNLVLSNYLSRISDDREDEQLSAPSLEERKRNQLSR